MLTKLTPIEAADEIIYQRHIIQKLRREMTYTRRPDLVQNGIDYARLALKCARRVYLFFRVILSGRSFFRGIVRGGRRLESIAGHSFPRGVHDIPRHAFPSVGGGGVQILFNFFRDSN